MDMFKYFPHTQDDINKMLEKINVKSLDDIFSDIPNSCLVEGIDLDSSLSEQELRKKVFDIASSNKQLKIYRGYGSYDVYTPSIINYLISREEFLTSYTPYQAEISQGTLQYIFEFQSMICELTKLDVANASMYDGATSLAEAIMMSVSHTRKNKVLLSKTINKYYLDVALTYCKFKGIEVEFIEEKNYLLDTDDVLNKIDNTYACVCASYPNCYGYIEEYNFTEKLKQNKCLFVLTSDISTLSILKSPNELGADICCGDMQTLGISLSCGGPYIGYLACKEALVRKMPGRIVGMTTDRNDKRGYVLTLQAREQHIRREKATSNICSNQSLMALHVTIYMSLLGKNGLKETQYACINNSHYLYEKLLLNPNFEKVCDNEFVKEFVIKTKFNVSKLNEYLETKGYLGGIDLGDGLLILCATETKTKEDIDEFVKVVGEYYE